MTMTLRSALLASFAMLFSLAFACAAPFAALAAVAARRMAPREALFTMLLAWLANQAIGYGLLNYPVDASSIAWGLALGLAALAAGAAALAVQARLPLRNEWLALAAGFAAAFIVNQAALFLLGLGLPGGVAAFTPVIIHDVLQANLLGLAVLAALMLVVDLFQRPGQRATA
jgi:hypothetical protein